MNVVCCYAPEDAFAVEPVAAWLTDQGLQVEGWRLGRSASLLDRLRRGVQPTDRLVVFLSPASVQSRWVRQDVSGRAVMELSAARQYNHHFVTPVLLQSCDVPIWLQDRVGANFANKAFDAACQELYTTVLGALLAPCADQAAAKNRVFRTWDVKPVGAGRYAKVIEFGVCMRCTQGLHVIVDAGGRYTMTRDWFGPPNTPRVPAQSGGPFYNSSLVRHPPIYARRFNQPEITPTQSYYLYIESEEPLRVKERLFADSYGRAV